MFGSRSMQLIGSIRRVDNYNEYKCKIVLGREGVYGVWDYSTKIERAQSDSVLPAREIKEEE